MDNEAQKFSVYNRSTRSFLDVEVVLFDTTVEPLKGLFDLLAARTNTGIWLTPYRGIPPARGGQPFDLIYLDEQCRVIQEVELYPSPQVRPLLTRPASVLILPVTTVFASQIHPGDNLAIRVSDEQENRSQRLPGQAGSSPIAAGTDSPAAEHTDKNDLPSSVPEDRAKQVHLAIQKLDERGTKSKRKTNVSLMDRFSQWLYPEKSDRRSAGRHPLPGLVAYHWSGGTPQAYRLGNISETGFYLLTEDRPYPGTMLLMTLQKMDTSGGNLGDSIPVYTKVIRWGPDGVAFLFVLSEPADTKSSSYAPGSWADRKSLMEFLKGLNLPGQQ